MSTFRLVEILIVYYERRHLYHADGGHPGWYGPGRVETLSRRRQAVATRKTKDARGVLGPYCGERGQGSKPVEHLCQVVGQMVHCLLDRDAV